MSYSTKIFCTPEEIAQNIKVRTIYSGKTQKEMFSTLNIGVNLLRDMRKGSYPRIDTLYKIANYLGCTVNDLVYKD